MDITSHTDLTEYQSAVLNEMGISAWRLADEERVLEKSEQQSIEMVATTSAATTTTSKENALAKLKQLKTQTHAQAQEQPQISETTDSLLVTFSQSESKQPIFSDILIALGLDTKTQKYISYQQLDRYSGYPFSWTQGSKVSLQGNQLITPALAKLHQADTKKQLWHVLQNALSPANR